MEEFISILKDFGFPVAVCAVLFWKSERDNVRHMEEMDKFSEAVNNNTTAITRLLERIPHDPG